MLVVCCDRAYTFRPDRHHPDGRVKYRVRAKTDNHRGATAMPRPDLYPMFLLGLLGSGHCIGMCGPLVFAFPARTGKFLAHLLYHTGRICTYVLIGAVVGAIGAGLTAAGPLDPAAVQRLNAMRAGLNIIAALFLAGFGLSRLGLLPEPAWMSLAAPSRIPGFRKVATAAVDHKSPPAIFVLGLLLGLLPCGLSWAAFARVLPCGNGLAGGILLLAFGLGTLPGLLLLGTGASAIVRRYQRTSDILAGLLMLAMAVKIGIRLAVQLSA